MATLTMAGALFSTSSVKSGRLWANKWVEHKHANISINWRADKNDIDLNIILLFFWLNKINGMCSVN